MLVSEKFQLLVTKATDGSKQVISQFYHSPVDNRRVSPVKCTDKTQITSVLLIKLYTNQMSANAKWDLFCMNKRSTVVWNDGLLVTY